MKSYKATMNGCFVGYAVQAIVNNFAPLLFLTFQNTYGIPLAKITLLITVNFILQLTVDLVSVFVIDKIGYRRAMIAAHVFCAAGFILMTVLPELFADAFFGLLISVIIYAIGGGILEVVVSPIAESCPTDNKEKAMSLLHSFYCWGSLGVIVLSSIYFAVLGTENWKYLSMFWAIIPIANALLFTKVPVSTLIAENETQLKVSELFKNKDFQLALVLMFAAGSCELSITQWASAFAEKMIGIPKTMGDLAGPALFSLIMGTARVVFGKTEKNLDLPKIIRISGILCLVSYLLIALSPIPIFSFVGFALCGLSVAILWPGTFSLASAAIKRGGTAMFALLALAGDLGCTGGPSFLGFVSSAFSDNLRIGVMVSLIFPILLITAITILISKNKKESK